MACNEWRDDWIAHLYDEATPDERSAIDAHLAGCASCRETLRALGEARNLLGEFAPSVPAVPRVVVLRPRSAWSNAWAFAAGLAAATLVFFAGTLAASRGAEPLGSAEGIDRLSRNDSRSSPPLTDGSQTDFASLVEGLDGRVSALEEVPRPIDAGLASSDALTRDELEQELDRASRRFRHERAEDLEHLVRWLDASEQRTGAFMDRTQEALTYLALRSDPSVRER